MAELVWTRRYSFQSVHSLKVVKEKRHGHQYFLEVSFKGGAIDAADEIVKAEVIENMTGREITGFQHASGEYLVDGLQEILKKEEPGPRCCGVAL